MVSDETILQAFRIYKPYTHNLLEIFFIFTIYQSFVHMFH